MPDAAAAPGYPRLTYLRIKNYRALRDVELRDLTPLTVFIGPNGSGKSTILDALAFLAEAVSGNLQQAWEKRNRFTGMRTRGQEGPIEFEVEVNSDFEQLRYTISFEEKEMVMQMKAFVRDERLEGKEPAKTWFKICSKGEEIGFTHTYSGAPFVNGYCIEKNEVAHMFATPDHPFLGMINGLNSPYSEELQSSALSILNLLNSYRYIHLTDDHLKGYSDAGPREKLSANGDNLPNVLYYLHTKHPEALARISEKLRRWVPGLAEVVTEITSDERLLLRFRDAPFEKPLPAQYMSDGTMRLAALLTLLYEPNATGLLGIEEPENELHPRLLPRLAEELSKATETRQLLVATHSPFLLDALEPEQVWILDRGADGYTQATRTADIPQVKELVEDGSPLGYLWTSNFFRLGDPLAPRTPADR
ncbi:ABC transporter ATP-binding protein [Hymenobacter sediminis]|uniref:AAA family ATPase n=1 Tax=Hymenobacter sediminis TaxID=2218621 RepID=UPI000DA68813|nr:AAA family ATPase [Hymenobacter sediminis]RPD49735.1 ABC transporter ATP-binding protein [Hymenobacter sediminis]